MINEYFFEILIYVFIIEWIIWLQGWIKETKALWFSDPKKRFKLMLKLYFRFIILGIICITIILTKLAILG